MKILGLLTAGLFGLGQVNSTEQCVDLCPDSPSYEAFGGYLEGLSNCEKKELLPTMQSRYDYMKRSEEYFAEAENFSDDELEPSLGEVYVILQKELKLLEAEFKATQAMLFSDCITDDSLKILSKHISIITQAMENTRKQIAELEDQM